jgi:dTDP-4-dehydrorhamnose 3,5-epimerase
MGQLRGPAQIEFVVGRADGRAVGEHAHQLGAQLAASADDQDARERGAHRRPPKPPHMPIEVLPTDFVEARIFVPEVFGDDRGFFKETYSSAKYGALGLSDQFVQDSVSFSKRNVLRGLHYDMRMSKLVQVLRGRVFDVIVDLRDASPTRLRWQGFDLSAESHRQLYVPAGFGHGFLALSDDVVFSYKQGAAFDPVHERSVRWNDPALAIAWPLAGEPILSAKDRAAPTLG